ncbi:hypothetical protein DEU56DRAFT_814483 [Suillus clintonianus]|uniref:uncharacterized protein n=1 Tax=Suillus clintonianus TaxID=1904413 RepID=UPI001B86823D|nr:uncharacterized protein DEU56DRAFT_814483 [Suillus clintonianus]KAG2131023.1 hypothetical protein DEU56DRAFT_814483 [Suillus clintonianus]
MYFGWLRRYLRSCARVPISLLLVLFVCFLTVSFSLSRDGTFTLHRFGRNRLVSLGLGAISPTQTHLCTLIHVNADKKCDSSELDLSGENGGLAAFVVHDPEGLQGLRNVKWLTT